MKVLVACEFSGVVRDAFKEIGHDAWSCDILPTKRPGKHFQCDVREVLGLGDWDLMIAHGRQQEAIDFFMELIDAQTFYLIFYIFEIRSKLIYRI